MLLDARFAPERSPTSWGIRDGNAMNRGFPAQLVHGALRQDERRARACAEPHGFAARYNFIFAGSAQNHVYEVLHVFMAGYDTRWSRVILDGQSSPARRDAG